MNLEQFSSIQFSEESFKKFDIPAKDKRELVSLVNDSIFRKCARTSKEKFEVLDLRDKVLKLVRHEIGNLINSSNATSGAIGGSGGGAIGSSSITSEPQTTFDPTTNLIGNCMDMCPEKERYSREYLSLCNKFEMRKESSESNETVDQRIMVKEYSRSSADQDLPLPNEVRPIKVLYETMLYLIHDIISKITDDDLNEDEIFIGNWYDFVWNRTRSIRKDIIQQRLLLNDRGGSNDVYQNGINNYEQQPTDLNQIGLVDEGLGGVLIVEQCARFHIMCAYRLCELASNLFDFKINENNLKDCFQCLRQYYETSASRLKFYSTTTSHMSNVRSLKTSPNESEFRSYIILLNLNESDILCEVQRWPPSIRNSLRVRFALNVYFTYNSHNYVRFFRLVKSNECDYLQSCILHRYFHKIRCEAFRSIFASYRDNKERSFPLNKLAELLAFDNFDEVYEYCELFGLDIDDNLVTMRSAVNVNSCFKLNKSNEDRLRTRRSIGLVDNKFKNKLIANRISKEDCFSQIIAGPLSKKTSSCFGLKSSASHRLHSSFNEDGFYSSDEINQLLNLAKQTSSSTGSTLAVSSSGSSFKFLKNEDASGKQISSIQSNESKSVKLGVLKRANSLVKKAQLNSTKTTQRHATIAADSQSSSSAGGGGGGTGVLSTTSSNATSMPILRRKSSISSSTTNQGESALKTTKSRKQSGDQLQTTSGEKRSKEDQITRKDSFTSGQNLKPQRTVNRTFKMALSSLNANEKISNNETNESSQSPFQQQQQPSDVKQLPSLFQSIKSDIQQDNPFSSIINSKQPLTRSSNDLTTTNLIKPSESQAMGGIFGSTFSNMTSTSSTMASTRSNLFSASQTSESSFGKFPSFQQTAQLSSQVPTAVSASVFSSSSRSSLAFNKAPSTSFPLTEASEPRANLFENLLKKQDHPSSDQMEKREKYLEQKSENFFQSLYLEIMKDFIQRFIQTHRYIPIEIVNELIDSVIQVEIIKIANETMPIMKSLQQKTIIAKQNEMRQQEEANYIQRQLVNKILDGIFDDLVKDIIGSNFSDWLKLVRETEDLIYDDLLCVVFQKEFEIIIKQIANELNNEILLDRLAEGIYFADSTDLCLVAQSSTNLIRKDSLEEQLIINENGNEELRLVNREVITDSGERVETSEEFKLKLQTAQFNSNSIFMNDLHSFLHECIFEFTRLNLNVNRELYFELKQVLNLNEQKYLFRKWRLKLSLKLLANKRACFDLEQSNKRKLNNRRSNRAIDLTTNTSLVQSNNNQQLLHRLISFMSSYGSYLLKNLNRFQTILDFMILNSDYSIVHCDQFQMHLAWNSNINYKHYLSELLLENYFHIIHNRDEFVLLPPFTNPSLTLSPLAKNNLVIDQSPIGANNNYVLYLKTVVAIPKLNESSKIGKSNDNIIENEEDIEAIKHWLMAKLFHFDAEKTYSYETQHIENVFVTMLHSNSYGLRFCIKVCSTQMSQSDYLAKLNKRTLYGSNSMIYVLMPFDEQSGQNNFTFKDYLIQNRNSFRKILKLFNENIDLDNSNTNPSDLYEFMFVSYLNDYNQTKKAIDFLLNNKDQNSSNINAYCYCQLEGDVVKDNGIFLKTYKQFLINIYQSNSKHRQFGATTTTTLSAGVDSSPLSPHSNIKQTDKTSSPPLHTQLQTQLQPLQPSSSPSQTINTTPSRASSQSTIIPTAASFESINNVLSLTNIFNLSLMKFVQFLSHSSSNKSIEISICSILNEYNSRLDNLIKMLTLDEYRKVAWPIPEFLDLAGNSNSSDYWTLKYWNTNECFDQVIRGQFYNLMCLDIDAANSLDLFERDISPISSNDGLIEFDNLEKQTFDYLNKLLAKKIQNGTFPSQSAECVKSIYQLESSIKINLQTLKLKRVEKRKDGKLLISKSDIEWPRLVQPIIEYLLTNGFLTFQNSKKMSLSQFYFYCNLNEIKSFDWINNCPFSQSSCSTNSSPQSSVSSVNLVSSFVDQSLGLFKSNLYVPITTTVNPATSVSSLFIKKYERKDKPNQFERMISANDDTLINKRPKSNNLKRRLTRENSSLNNSTDENSSNWSFMVNATQTEQSSIIDNNKELESNENLNKNEFLTSSFSSKSPQVNKGQQASPLNPVKQQKYQRLMSNTSLNNNQSTQPSYLGSSNQSNEFDLKFQEFLSVLNTEKENNRKFETRLNKLVANNNNNNTNNKNATSNGNGNNAIVINSGGINRNTKSEENELIFLGFGNGKSTPNNEEKEEDLFSIDLDLFENENNPALLFQNKTNSSSSLLPDRFNKENKFNKFNSQQSPSSSSSSSSLSGDAMSSNQPINNTTNGSSATLNEKSLNLNETLENFLERLKEEKTKNEKFNSKLNQMLNY